jgi:molybdopterin biosynthesis enzyme
VIDLAAAQTHVLERVAPLPAVEVPLDDALGAVTATEVVAAEAVPPFVNSAMDGYAVRAADTADAPVDLDVVGMVAAGAAPDVGIGPGQALRIMTGAPLPDGADAVVLVERTRTHGDRVTIEVEVVPGRRRGPHRGSSRRAGQHWHRSCSGAPPAARRRAVDGR